MDIKAFLKIQEKKNKAIRKQIQQNKDTFNAYLIGDKEITTGDIKYAITRRYIPRPKIHSIEELYKKVKKYFRYITKNEKGKIEEYDARLIRVYFKNKENGKLKMRFIKADLFSFLDNILIWYEELDHEPEKGGSDGIDNELYEPFFDFFDIVYSITFQGEGDKFKTKFFKTEETEYKKDYCGFSCLKKVCNITIEEYDKLELKKLDNMIEYIKDNKLNVAIISNYIKYTGDRKDNKKFFTVEEGRYKKQYYKIKDDEYEINLLYGDEEAEYKIIYCLESEHYEITKNIELEEIYININNELIKKKNNEYNKINHYSQQTENLIKNQFVKPKLVNTEYIFFDYETITDYNANNVNKPYSISFFHATLGRLEKLNNIETRNDKEDLKKMIERHTYFYTGFDCSKHLINFISSKHNTKFYLIGFNSANFDNFILYNDLLNLEGKDKIDNLGEPLIANGQLLNFKIHGTHEMYDIRKHIGSSLSKNCKAFNINLCAKKQDLISHYEMQKKFDNNELLDYIKDNAELKEYNIFDCLSLGLLFYKYRVCVSQVKGFENYEVEKYMTLGQMVFNNLDEYLKKNEINMPKFYLTKEGKKNKKMKKDDIKELQARYLKYFNDISKNRVAGRVQLFNGVQEIINNLIASIDVCSLYPYVMAVQNNYYTAGEIVEVEKYEDKPEDLIGWFYCNVNQSNLEVKILAEKTKEGNNWEAEKLENVFISSVLIDFLIESGAEVEIKNGLYFSQKVKGCDMFKPLLEIMKLKNEEDEKKNKKDKNYNPALREVYKLMMNIISGKLNQKMNRDERKILNGAEFAELLNNPKISDINTIIMIDDKAHISYKKAEEDCIKSVKPVSNGCLIYDYAKIYMIKHAYTKVNKSKLIYTDTDSNKLRNEDFIEWVKYAENEPVPHWEEVEKYDERYKTHKLYSENSKVFGSFENEYKDNDYTTAYFLQKKVYLCSGKDSKPAFHFKGISENDMIIPEDFKITDSKELSRIFNENVYKRIKDNFLEFFQNLHIEKKIKLMGFSIQRITNNLKKNVEFDDSERTNKKCYSLVSNYRIKNINIK